MKRTRRPLEDVMRFSMVGSMLVVALGACGGSDAVEESGRWTFEVGDAPRIELHSRAGPVEIEAGPGSQVVVRSPAPEVTVEQEADTVRVNHEPARDQEAGAGFFITAPRSTTFDISLGHGGLRMQGFTDTQLRVRLREGPVEMDRVGGDIRVRVSTGAIDLRDVRGTVLLATKEGPISVRGRLRGSNAIRADEGGVLVELVGPNPLVVDATGSAVDTDFGLGSGRRARGTIGDGSAGSLDIRVREGPVEVRRHTP